MTDHTNTGDDRDKPAKHSLKNIDHSEIKSSAFWVGQLMLIAATIVGVYLAAQAGLEKAIEFDNFDDTQNNYYLRKSLYEEVNDNLALLRGYDNEYLSKNVSDTTLKLHHPELNTYVWETMKFSPYTLETPSRFLSAVRRFYAATGTLVNKVEARQLGAGHASRLLKTELERMEQKVLPDLEADLRQLAGELKNFGIDVDKK